MFNKNVFNASFSDVTIQQVWEKGTVVPEHDPRIYRKDTCGAWMQRDKYGDTSSQYGWEIDHIRPKSKGGGDDLANLQPLQWANNRHKADNYPNWSCKLKAA